MPEAWGGGYPKASPLLPATLCKGWVLATCWAAAWLLARWLLGSWLGYWLLGCLAAVWLAAVWLAARLAELAGPGLRGCALEVVNGSRGPTRPRMEKTRMERTRPGGVNDGFWGDYN